LEVARERERESAGLDLIEEKTEEKELGVDGAATEEVQAH